MATVEKRENTDSVTASFKNPLLRVLFFILINFLNVSFRLFFRLHSAGLKVLTTLKTRVQAEPSIGIKTEKCRKRLIDGVGSFRVPYKKVLNGFSWLKHLA